MPATDLQSYFIQQGILGVIILILGGVIAWMQRRLDEKDKEIKNLYDSVNIVQEKRISDNQQIVASSIKSNGDAINAISAVKTAVDGITRVLELRK